MTHRAPFNTTLVLAAGQKSNCDLLAVYLNETSIF
jgi:hypothetical protein